MDPEGSRPQVTVLVPCRNEVRSIGRCLDSLLATEYPLDRLEVLVIDGSSGDGTREVLRGYTARYPTVRLLDNEGRTTPRALNLGLSQARGEIILRADAHSVYPPTYIPRLVAWLQRSGADNVGGVWRILPGGPGAVAQAIAACLAHPLGAGNARYRIGASEPRWVDTVPFGCYRCAVFERLGGFDEELVRNQDDEFNYRLLRAGGRILLVPEVVCDYYARDSLRKLWRTYYQYGRFKPLVVQKVGRIMTVRQVVPTLFLALVTILGLAGIRYPLAAWTLTGILLLYGGSILCSAAGVARRHGLLPGLVATLVFPTLHVSYGLGMLQGIVECALRRGGRGRHVADVPVTR